MIDQRSRQGSSGGLLRRVFSRASSPKRSDNVREIDNLSTERKSQMLLYKQRNEMIRKEEFAELRVLHAQRISQEGGIETLSSTENFNSINTKQSETLEKINQLESQMASRWSQRQEQNDASERAPSAPPKQTAAQQQNIPPVGNYQLPSKELQADFASLADPVLEEIAVLFASGEDAQVEQSLCELIEKDSPNRMDRPAWLTLFDFYRATGQQSDFEQAAIEYTSLFSVSAPQWLPFDPALLRKQQSTDNLVIGSVYWIAPEVFSAESALGMKEKLLKAPEKSARVIDWSSLSEISPDGARHATQILEALDKPNNVLQIAGKKKLLQALKVAETKAPCNEQDPICQLRLKILQLFCSAEEFEVEAMEYCLRYEVSPPAWHKPQAITSDLDVIESTEESNATAFDSTNSSIMSTMVGDFSTEFYGQNVKSPLRLRGIYKGSMVQDLKDLDAKIYESEGFLNVDCEKLVRVDFAAAGDLFNWVSEKQNKGYIIQLVDVHRLVALFFAVMGISAIARLSLRRD